MSAKAEIDFSALMGAVSEFRRNMSDASRALPVIAESLHSHVIDVFDKEGAVPGHSKWPPLSPATLKRRRASANPKILQDTTHLIGSITPYASGTFVEAYTNVPYAIYHVSKAPRRVIPLRDFFAIDEKSFYADAADTLLAIITKGSR